MVGTHFDVPPPTAPPVSAEQAVAVAWEHIAGAEARQITDVLPVHALLPAGGNIEKDVEVWVLKFHGACIVGSGPRAEGETAGSGCEPVPVFIVMIDANTGAYMASLGSEV